jgi:spore germination protein
LKGVVTNRQIFFMLLFTLTSGSLISIPKDSFKAAGTGAWFTMMILTIIFSIGVFFIASLNKKFEGKTIFEYSNLLVGKPISIIINFIYTSFYLLALISLFRMVAEFVKGCFLNLTPIWAISLLFVVTSLYIAYKGITNIGRLCEIYGAVFIATSLSVHAAMFYLGDITQIQPFFEPKRIKEYVFAAKDLFVSMLGIEILTIIPFGKVNSKKGVIYSVLGVVYVGLFYVFAIETSVMILGVNDVLNYNNSLIEALRETKLPSTILLERVDVLFLTVGFFGVVSGLSILLYGTVENISKLFSKINKNKLFIIIGVVIYVVSNFFINADLANLLFNTGIPVVGVFTSFIIPIALFTIAKVKEYAK